ncbi:MAG: methylenetetrahydrofolate reductase [NAD(P)H] [Bacteroidales bacterium]|nr:methylenetetrahydrofolate reductase [NAD(P)H] [Bacteroidales bacterium]
MKIGDIIAGKKKAFPSLEIVPPLKGVSREELMSSIRPFKEYEPPFINITCHREEYEFRREKDGSYSRHTVKSRMSQTAVCAAIQAEFKSEVVPHVICGGASADDIGRQLSDFSFLGIDNLMALRGDSLIGEKRFTPTPGGYSYASELVQAIRSYGKANGRDFCIGVGGYPEKHFEAPNLEADILNLKKKVDAGADFIISQMFFDNRSFYSFRDACRKAGISVPIIPGIKPLSTLRQLTLLPEAFSIDIPQELVKEMNANADNNGACYRIGTEWCLSQCRDLLANGVPAIHFYTMGKAANIIDIISKLF